MKARLSLLLPLLLLLTRGPAQSYDFALGVRLGTEWGATAQLRVPQIQKNFVVESIVQTRADGDEGMITLLGKQHRPLLSRRLNLFYGAGLHAGWNNGMDAETGETFNGPKGVTGIVGMEATIGRVNLSYDFKPALNISGGESRLYAQTAISARYVIGKRHSIWDKQNERDMRKRRKVRKRDRRKEQRRRERAQSSKQWFEFWKG